MAKDPPVGIVKGHGIVYLTLSSPVDPFLSSPVDPCYMLPVFRQISLVSESMDFAKDFAKQKFKQCDKAQY